MAKRKGQLVGYVRVSTLDPHTERQLEGMNLVKVFTDKANGKDTKRPQLRVALDYEKNARRFLGGRGKVTRGPSPGHGLAP